MNGTAVLIAPLIDLDGKGNAHFRRKGIKNWRKRRIYEKLFVLLQ